MISTAMVVGMAWSAVVGAGSAADVQYHVQQVLEGGNSTAVDCQRELATLLGRRDESASGVVAAGQGVSIKDLDASALAGDWPSGVRMRLGFQVRARGPEPIQILAPVANDGGEAEGHELAVYRKASRGLYVRLLQAPKRSGRYLTFESSHPGRFVVCSTRETGSSAEKAALFDFTPTTSDPSARTSWGLFPVRPEEIAGPVPVILVHGLTTDRWGEFIQWAATSPEAEEFREHFQLWDFFHDATGIDAAIGFSRNYPAFDLSIVAYLDRFIREASGEGVETASGRYYLPAGPFMMVAHSTGGLKAHAFLRNFPEYLDRVLAVVSIGAPHTGTPLATPEWLRHTFTRLATPPLPSAPCRVQQFLTGGLAELFATSYMRTDRQSDLDAGWGNFDAEGGFGIPTISFEIWEPHLTRAPRCGLSHLTLSPRDANQTDARTLPGINDTTFEPQVLRSTYCGGLDKIMPSARGEDGLDKFFAYASYIERPADWLDTVRDAEKAYQEPQRDPLPSVYLENLALRIMNAGMGIVASRGTDAPLGLYALNDGMVPLQSAAFLDGKQTELLYETKECDGYRYPVTPLQPKLDLIREHTLFEPDRIRILAGWSHLDTVTGRYHALSGHSELYSMIAEDLLSVLP